MGKPVTDDELNEALKTLRTKKNSGYAEISSDVIKHISPPVFELIEYTFDLPIKKGIFPDQIKIAKVKSNSIV